MSQRLSPVCRTADLFASAATDGDAGVDVGTDLYANANGALDTHSDRGAHGHCHLARHPNSYSRANADADAHTDARSHGHMDAYADSELHGRAVPDPIRHDDDRADRDSRSADTDGHLHADPHASPRRHADADGHPCAYRSADGDDGAAYCHTGSDRYHASHCDIHS